MQFTRTLLIALFAALTVPSLSGCDPDNSAEEIGEELDDAADEAADEFDDAT